MIATLLLVGVLVTAGNVAVGRWLRAQDRRRTHLEAYRSASEALIASDAAPLPEAIRTMLQGMARDYAPGRLIHSAMWRGLFGRKPLRMPFEDGLPRTRIDAELSANQRQYLARAFVAYVLAASYRAPITGALFRRALSLLATEPAETSERLLTTLYAPRISPA